MTEVFSYALPGILLGAVFIGAAYLIVALLKERGGGGEVPDMLVPGIEVKTEEERGEVLEILMREFHGLRCNQVTASEREALMHLSTAIQRMRRGEDVPTGVLDNLLLHLRGGEEVLRKLWGEEL